MNDHPATIALRINRGEENDAEGRWDDYEIPYADGMAVLDAVLMVQARQAPDLAVRWNCKAAKCGSCSAEICGKPRLMCKTRLEELDCFQPVVVAPLRTFRRIRDLVTDVAWNYRVNEGIAPFRAQRDRAWRFYPKDVERAQEMRKCIECFLCQDVCHVLRYQTEEKPRFAGPRFFARAAGLDFHPMDDLERTDYLRTEGGIGLCNITKCCSDVCPEGINITDNAIIPEKERIVDAHADPLRQVVAALFSGRKPQ
jgi:succinate dehydrogenase / fumarate reductase iron-sulfur subunit